MTNGWDQTRLEMESGASSHRLWSHTDMGLNSSSSCVNVVRYLASLNLFLNRNVMRVSQGGQLWVVDRANSGGWEINPIEGLGVKQK